MLIDRLKSSAVLLSIVGVLLYLDAAFSLPGAEGLWLFPLLLFFSLGTAWEMATLMRAGGRRVSRRAALVGTAVVTLSAGVPLIWSLAGSDYPADCPVGRLGWMVVASIVAVFGIFLGEMLRYGQREKGAIERTVAAVFVSLYVGLPMALLAATRMLGGGNWGLAALMTMIITTKSADAGAYFVGKSLGRRKLIPRLSPGKTVEGSLGGVVIATIVAFACLNWLFPWLASADQSVTTPPSLWWSLALGPLLAVAGMIGDLAESLVKRELEAKDSGNLLPGLGGVWDVTDSLIAAVMPAFLCFAAAL